MDKIEYDRAYYQRNKDKRLSKIRAYREENRDKLLEYDRKRNACRGSDHADKKNIARLARVYNLNLQQAKEYYLASMTSCEVCGTEWDPSIHKHRFCVDHNHNTGVVRGVLCHHCNAALGHLREDNTIILALLEYNRKHNGKIS